MKKYFLFAAAALLSLSMFAGDGSTKADAINYDWQNGTTILPRKDHGLWYKVDLEAPEAHLQDGTIPNAEANIVIGNPMNVEVTLTVTAYVGDESQVKSLTIAPKKSRNITISAALLLKMNIKEIYLYVQTDKDIVEYEEVKKEVVDGNGNEPGDPDYIPTYNQIPDANGNQPGDPEYVETYETVTVEKEVTINVNTAEAGTIYFESTPFIWGQNNAVAANKEIWFEVELPMELEDKDAQQNYLHMVQFTVNNMANAAAEVEVAYSPEKPANGITEQTRTIGALGNIVKKSDVPAIMAMANEDGMLYIRVKSNKALNIKAETINMPSDVVFAFDATDAQDVVYNTPYSVNAAAKCFKMTIDELKSIQSYEKAVVEITNNSATETLVLNGAVATVVKPITATERSLTVAPGQTVKRAIDMTMVAGMKSGDVIYGELKANAPYSFIFKAECADEYPCADAIAFNNSNWSGKLQTVKSQWYAVELTNDMKTNGQNLEVTIETNTTTHITVDVALECTCGAQRQSYKSTINKTSTKLINNSLFKGITGNVVYVRVEADQEITVKVAPEEIVPTVSGNWNDINNWNAWNNGSQNVAGKTEDVRVKGNVTIPDGYTAEANGVELYGPDAIFTVEGKLIVGDNGITGIADAGQFVIKEGAQVVFLGTNNVTPAATVEKNIVAYKNDGAYYYQAITLPAANAPQMNGMHTYEWINETGWNEVAATNAAFKGYLLATSNDTQLGTVEFRGKTFGNSNQSLYMPGDVDHFFGNSYLADINIEKLCEVVPAELFVMRDGTWQTVNSTLLADASLNQPIAVGEGFAVRTPAAGYINLNYEEMVATEHNVLAPARVATPSKMVRLTIEAADGMSDRMYLMGGETEYAGKMKNNRPFLNVYANVNGKVCTLVKNQNLVGTTVTLEANNCTDYTLRAELVSGDILYVKDLVNGNVIALTEGVEYNFTAEANKTSNRFQVIGVQHVTTGIESTEIEGINKVIENGQVMIIKNGVKYNTVGQIVK